MELYDVRKCFLIIEQMCPYCCPPTGGKAIPHLQIHPRVVHTHRMRVSALDDLARMSKQRYVRRASEFSLYFILVL